MTTMILLFLLTIATTVIADSPTTCKRDFRKAGCFKRNSSLLTDLIITDLDPTHEKWGKVKIDWADYQTSLHSLACRCRAKAVGKYSYFSIGFYGDCWAGNDKEALERKMINPGEHASSACVNGAYNKCNENDHDECAGIEDNEFIYEITGIVTTIPPTMPRITTEDPDLVVQCGTHKSVSCAACVQGRDSSACNGVCTWSNNQCIPSVHQRTVCQKGTIDIKCRPDTRIQIKSSLYGRHDKKTCGWRFWYSTRCQATSSSKVERDCNGKQTCSIPASNSYHGEPCWGTSKYLSVQYQCYSTKSNALTYKSITCEGRAMNIKCSKPNTSIHIRNVNYGRTDRTTCSGPIWNRTNCRSPQSTRDKVMRDCNGHSSCSVPATNSYLGDACWLTSKYLEVDYQCK